jgi:hypothetical protein
MSLKAFAHSLVCAFRRKNELLIAASGASFSSSQKPCVVGRDVIRKSQFSDHTRQQHLPRRYAEENPVVYERVVGVQAEVL